MKKLLIILLVLPAAVFAQRSYNNLDNFNIGDKASYIDVDETGIQAGNTGANVTWDFSNSILLTDTLRINIVPPISTQWGSLFTGADITERHSDGRYYYYQKTTNNNFLIGFADSSRNTVSFYTKNSAMFANRPMKYSDSATDFFEDSSGFSGTPVTGGGFGKVNADAYGTLKLPGNITYYNVLRLKIYQYQTDSFEVSPGIKQTITAITSSYWWYDTVSNFAVFKLDSFSVGGFSDKRARMLYKKPTDIYHISNDKDIRCYYAGGVLYVDKGILPIGDYKVSLFDMSGRELEVHDVKGKHHFALDIKTALISGIYIVKIEDYVHRTIFVKRLAVTDGN